MIKKKKNKETARKKPMASRTYNQHDLQVKTEKTIGDLIRKNHAIYRSEPTQKH